MLFHSGNFAHEYIRFVFVWRFACKEYIFSFHRSMGRIKKNKRAGGLIRHLTFTRHHRSRLSFLFCFQCSRSHRSVPFYSMADSNEFVTFVGARTLSDATSIPTSPVYTQPPSSTQPAPPPASPTPSVPTQPMLRQQGKSGVSLLNEYVQRNGNGSSTINYTYNEGQGFCATVHVLDREFVDSTYYPRKQEAKESVSRIALAGLEGVNITPAVVTVAPNQLSPSVIERKLTAWLARNGLSSDGRWHTAEPKRPVSLLNELCQILQLNPIFKAFKDPETMCGCTLTIGYHVYHASPSYYPNECKDTVARYAIENIVTNYNNGQIMSSTPSDPSDTLNFRVPPPDNPLPPPTPSLTNPDGSSKPYVNLLHELCTMRMLGEPLFTYVDSNKEFKCDVQVGPMFVNGTSQFAKKGEAKEHTARLAYERFLANSSM